MLLVEKAFCPLRFRNNYKHIYICATFITRGLIDLIIDILDVTAMCLLPKEKTNCIFFKCRNWSVKQKRNR